jgi:hypothetical protein
VFIEGSDVFPELLLEPVNDEGSSNILPEVLFEPVKGEIKMLPVAIVVAITGNTNPFPLVNLIELGIAFMLTDVLVVFC